jgi:hypothetical protein
LESIPALAMRALLFDGDAYLKMQARPRAARDGLWLLLVLGAALGLASTTGAILSWAATPELAQVQRVLGRELAAVPLLRRLQASAPWLAMPLESRWLWLAARWSRPTPLLALLRLAGMPLGLLAGWLGFGLVAHGLATLFGGRGRLGPTLGCLALAEAPRVLFLMPLWPPLGLAGLGIWAWVLAARFEAIRAAHRLDGWRALWALLLAVLLLAGLVGCWLAGIALLAWVVR